MSLTAAQEAELIANAVGPKRTTVDGTTVEMPSASDVVAFLKYCKSQETAPANNPTGMRFSRRIGPGTTGST